ncbi:hypothetical protein NP233_g9270 [Leucocoprinus birnbaumii]|uniref:DUF6535 domain-containing protein n=1 Tax=Leucocoprinus birnbaumii TaxID=56174 RepID=A0AAD5YMD4_9AGAR|nr:hypothetical protein NP233_g9270 [Leucocoprinus birnbaumii]
MSTTSFHTEAVGAQSPDPPLPSPPDTQDTKIETAQPQCPCLAAHGSENQPKDPWETCLKYAKKHVDDETAQWKGEVDSLLIFASLFSGVTAAFAIESYHNVRQDPADTTVLLLKTLITIQINATNPQPNIPVDLDPVSPITASARRVNIYNFLSLILSLSVVTAGILCLQWLREYGADPQGIPCPRYEQLGIRYMRRDGMKKWGVFKVLRLLPLILLLSLLLFFAGLIELLIGVDHAAAVAASITIGIATFFMLITTILPTLQCFLMHFFHSPQLCFPEIPFKSPQAWVFYKIVTMPVRLARWVKAKVLHKPQTASPTAITVLSLQTWSDFDWLVYEKNSRLPSPTADAGFGIHWLGKMYLQETELARSLFECIRDSSIRKTLCLILSLRDFRRARSVNEASKWTPPPSPEANVLAREHLSNVIAFQTLAHLTEQVEGGHSPSRVLVKERLELYLKISEASLDPDFDCPLISGMDQKGLIPVAPATRKSLVQCITGLLNLEMNVNRSHLDALEHIIAIEYESKTPDLEIFVDVLHSLCTWIAKKRESWYSDGQNLPKASLAQFKLWMDASSLYDQTDARWKEVMRTHNVVEQSSMQSLETSLDW